MTNALAPLVGRNPAPVGLSQAVPAVEDRSNAARQSFASVFGTGRDAGRSEGESAFGDTAMPGKAPVGAEATDGTVEMATALTTTQSGELADRRREHPNDLTENPNDPESGTVQPALGATGINRASEVEAPQRPTDAHESGPGSRDRNAPQTLAIVAPDCEARAILTGAVPVDPQITADTGRHDLSNPAIKASSDGSQAQQTHEVDVPTGPEEVFVSATTSQTETGPTSAPPVDDNTTRTDGSAIPSVDAGGRHVGTSRTDGSSQPKVTHPPGGVAAAADGGPTMGPALHPALGGGSESTEARVAMHGERAMGQNRDLVARVQVLAAMAATRGPELATGPQTQPAPRVPLDAMPLGGVPQTQASATATPTLSAFLAPTEEGGTEKRGIAEALPMPAKGLIAPDDSHPASLRINTATGDLSPPSTLPGKPMTAIPVSPFGAETGPDRIVVRQGAAVSTADIDPRGRVEHSATTHVPSLSALRPAVPAAATVPTPSNPVAPTLLQGAVEVPGGALDTGTEAETFDLTLSEIRTRDAMTENRIPSAAHTARADTARHVAAQIAEAIRGGGDRPIELSLNPAELGRVRLSLSAVDGTMQVAILTERGETLDLMRRHIDLLGQELRDLGYGGASFSFARDTDGGSSDPQPGHRDADADGASQADGSLSRTSATVGGQTDRLDIRL